MPDVMADRRGAARFPLILVAEVTELTGSAVLSARSSDVSRSGCYIDTLNPIPVGTQVQVRLRCGDEVFDSPARVMYVCPGLGMGVMFHKDLPETRLAILDRWLATAAVGNR
jgi:PilZ domain-containing protein